MVNHCGPRCADFREEGKPDHPVICDGCICVCGMCQVYGLKSSILILIVSRSSPYAYICIVPTMQNK